MRRLLRPREALLSHQEHGVRAGKRVKLGRSAGRYCGRTISAGSTSATAEPGRMSSAGICHWLLAKAETEPGTSGASAACTAHDPGSSDRDFG